MGEIITLSESVPEPLGDSLSRGRGLESSVVTRGTTKGDEDLGVVGLLASNNVLAGGC